MALYREGQGKLTWLVDFKGYSMRNAPSIRVSLATLSILQLHYPERLGMALCYHPPRLFSFTWKVQAPEVFPWWKTLCLHAWAALQACGSHSAYGLPRRHAEATAKRCHGSRAANASMRGCCPCLAAVAMQQVVQAA